MCAVSFSRTSRPLYVPCVWGYGSQCCYWHRCPFDRHNAHWTICPFLPNEDSPRRHLFVFDPRTNFFSFPSRKEVEFRQTVLSTTVNLYREPLVTRALLTAERVLAGVAVSNSSATLPWPPLALRQAEPLRPEERWTPNHPIATSAADRNCAVATSSHRDRSGKSERGGMMLFLAGAILLYFTPIPVVNFQLPLVLAMTAVVRPWEAATKKPATDAGRWVEAAFFEDWISRDGQADQSTVR